MTCRTCVYEHKLVVGIVPRFGTRVRSGAARVCVAAVAKAKGAAANLWFFASSGGALGVRVFALD